ncbi:MAG: hypothetical protein PHP25_03975 [Candidatus Moranbacteria bacterium]|nr:hypothetical protein [Candidatus Moranbacteria bacterium]
MPRRIKTKNSAKISSDKKFPAKAAKDLRFNVSLVFLIAALSASAYILLFSLTGNGKAFMNNPSVVKKAATADPANTTSQGGNQLPNDPALDFKLTIPANFGQWIYRVGSVKGITDDTLTDQFLKIYVDTKPAGNSTSFDDRFKDILTIRKFTAAEWKELEKGCNKGNSLLCDGAGTKINEKDGSVWAYTKSESCSKEMKASCAYIQKIIESFQFK